MQTALNESNAAPGAVLTLHTFGDYLNFHPHIHAIATDFLAAVTQPIPEKGAQTVKYYGYYSNKARGQREKKTSVDAGTHPAIASPLSCKGEGQGEGPDVLLDISSPAANETATPQRRRKIPTRAWRELIKRVGR